MFTEQYRESIRERIISKAKEDKRIAAAAVIGSYAKGAVDRWSDIDLTFGVSKHFTIPEMLSSWAEYVSNEFNGKKIFDLQSGNTTYRVFILPGCLQLDLSFSPASDFGTIGGHFHLLFGKQFPKSLPEQQSVEDIFGYLIHHILRARFCAERNKLWQSEFWLNESRNYALKLACIAEGVSADYGRGLDDLPINVLRSFEETFIKKLSKDDLLRTLRTIIHIIPSISSEALMYYKKFENTFIEIAQEESY